MSRQSQATFDTTVFDGVIATGDTAARVELATQLARLLADPGAPPEEKTAVIPALLKLTADGSADVRRELAQRLTPVSDLHADLLFAIVADEDAIALPFLAETAALDAWRMLAILHVGDVARQLVVAGRPDIAPEAVAEIAIKGSLEVAAVMLDNPACHVPGSDYRRLYTRFRNEPEIVERLLQRKDLPLEVRILQAKRASTRIQNLVTERGWIAANDAEAIIADIEETTVLRILEQARPAELDRLIPFMCERDMLNTALVLRAACRGQMFIVERALSWLSSMALKHVHGLIEGHSRIPLKALFSAAGLPAGAHLLMRASIDIWRETKSKGESLPPEEFSRRVVESLMISHGDLPEREKLRVLDLIERLTDERTRAIAARLRSTLQQAA